MTTSAPVRPTLGVRRIDEHTFAVASSSPSKPPYLVQAHGLQLVCECPAYRYAKSDPAACKHGAAVLSFLADETADRERWCEVCRLVPVTGGLPLCARCAEGSVHAIMVGPEGPSAIEAAAASPFDLAAEQAKVAACNARAERIFAGELQREPLL